MLLVAVWFVLTVVGRPGRRRPTDSVSEFARALTALDPARAPQPAYARRVSGGAGGARRPTARRR